MTLQETISKQIIPTHEAVIYTPTDMDLIHIREIEDFFNSREIPFIKDDKIFGVYYLNDGAIQVRYVNSLYHPMDNSKRFGDKCKGVDHNYFIDISHKNIQENIRTIWIFDFEMEQKSDIVTVDGEILKDYRRQWEVIKNTICTATGHIDTRIYARDCEVREIPKNMIRPFLDTNCFYGYRAANVNLGLFLKKDKHGLKAGTLLMLYSFGYNFYGNKKHQDDPIVEIIRVSTKVGCQVIGGASKCLKHFLNDYPTLHVGEKDIKVNKLCFYVDASHNDGRAMHAMGFQFVSWSGTGFMNMWTTDYDGSKEELEENRTVLKGKANEIFHRKPMFHRHIMRLIGEGKIISIANAGTQVYEIYRDEYLSRFEEKI